MTRRTMRQSLFELGKVRPMILEIENGIASIRPKGLRKRIYLDTAAIWQRGVKAEVDAKRRKKRR